MADRAIESILPASVRVSTRGRRNPECGVQWAACSCRRASRTPTRRSCAGVRRRSLNRPSSQRRRTQTRGSGTPAPRATTTGEPSRAGIGSGTPRSVSRRSAPSQAISDSTVTTVWTCGRLMRSTYGPPGASTRNVVLSRGAGASAAHHQDRRPPAPCARDAVAARAARAASATRTSAYPQQRTGFTASDPENDVPSAVCPVRLTEVELQVIPVAAGTNRKSRSRYPSLSRSWGGTASACRRYRGSRGVPQLDVGDVSDVQRRRAVQPDDQDAAFRRRDAVLGYPGRTSILA